MKKIRIGNDIHIEWSIYREGELEDFTNKDVSVSLIHELSNIIVPLEWEMKKGLVSATFYGKDQQKTGKYYLTLTENKDKKKDGNNRQMPCVLVSSMLLSRIT